ncbi:disease resistance protein RPV1-like [Vitis riparia]|uniref:disease resistance protein RPV1-like n=1 Tax=Vitis riparia TaxID=96939 RepID=UPI00155A5528|nr:disease resistance protein RPV1-like [Vitis riparia]
MASTSSTSTSISTFIPQWKYDVFLSFRGEDTRFNFTDHLYANLIRRGITTFRDDESLKRGEEIAPELLRAIEESRFSLIVFSENYAGSRWCLDELVKIMKCRKEMKQTVVPIFYHVDPSHVRHQTGRFGEAFSNYKEDTEEMKEKVRSWRSALTETANIGGEHVEKNGG